MSSGGETSVFVGGGVGIEGARGDPREMHTRYGRHQRISWTCCPLTFCPLATHHTFSHAAGLATLVSTSAQRRFDGGVHTASAGTEILPTRQAGHRRKSTVCTHYLKAKEY